MLEAWPERRRKVRWLGFGDAGDGFGHLTLYEASFWNGRKSYWSESRFDCRRERDAIEMV